MLSGWSAADDAILEGTRNFRKWRIAQGVPSRSNLAQLLSSLCFLHARRKIASHTTCFHSHDFVSKYSGLDNYESMNKSFTSFKLFSQVIFITVVLSN